MEREAELQGLCILFDDENKGTDTKLMKPVAGFFPYRSQSSSRILAINRGGKGAGLNDQQRGAKF